jgi:hypothetical protein
MREPETKFIDAADGGDGAGAGVGVLLYMIYEARGPPTYNTSKIRRGVD